MPRNTRSAAAKREKGEEVESRAEKELKVGQKTPSSKTLKKGELETTKDGISPPLSQKTPSKQLSAKVAGTRMSGVRHSGLLAKDEESRPSVGGSSDGVLPPKLSLSFDAADSEDPIGQFSGRDIYAFKGQVRHPNKGKGKSSQSQIDNAATGNSKLGKRKQGPSATQKQTGVAAGSGEELSENSGDERMEVDKSGEKSQERPKRKSAQVSSDSEEDVSDLSDEEGLTSIAARLNRGEPVGQVTETMVEDYFTIHAGKAGPTSDHTLAKLAQPRMDQESVQSVLKAVPSAFQADYQALYEDYKNLYPYWLFQMSNGFNILLHGLGSKLKLIEDFQSEHLSDTCHLVVNGYFPGLTVKQILSKLSGDLLGHTGAFKSHIEQAQFISSALEEQGSGVPEELFLLVHNIDGPMLRGDKAQTALSILAQCPHIHVVASVDHINAPLIWDQNKLSRFNWLWHDVTTYEPYSEETSYENSLLVQQSGTLVLSSLTHVTRSLTPNARGVFELLARYQLDQGSEAEGTYLGLSFHDLYLKCREKFLVNSDLTLRAQLTEFRDHKLVRSRKGSDGVEYLYIPVDDATLTQFLEQQAEE